MATFNHTDFLTRLRDDNAELKNFTESILELPAELLIKKPAAEKWNITECFDHMNKATELYLDQIEEKLPALRPASNGRFRASWLASVFSNGLAPGKAGQIRYKVKTLKPFIPKQVSEKEGHDPITRFRDNLDHYERILDTLPGKDLRSFKVVTALGPILKFTIGDALQFAHAHNRRHAQQVKNILASLNNPVSP